MPRICLFAYYGPAWDDPPTYQSLKCLLSNGYDVHLIHLGRAISNPEDVGLSGVQTHTVDSPPWSHKVRPLSNWLRWKIFQHEVRKCIERLQPCLIVTIMLHAAAALPRRGSSPHKRIMCVYDIPDLRDAGRLDRHVLARGWRNVRTADLVWCSDTHKAMLARSAAQLEVDPVVCHNVPTSDYMVGHLWPRDTSLRNCLRHMGAKLDNEEGCVLLRAGAIGEFGGIEETLDAMLQLPSNYVFLMLGRPHVDYKLKILAKVKRLELEHRVFLWERPSNDLWHLALRGCDVGHLIHGPFPPGRYSRAYAQNSALSTNRLFQYMAAGLPIITHDDPRMKAFVDDVRCVRMVRLKHLVEDIRFTWRELGSNVQEREALGRLGRNAHISDYCWERQFAPVLAYIHKSGLE
jgi:glycosyltransferase involved in cell wall biosynthesis